MTTRQEVLAMLEDCEQDPFEGKSRIVRILTTGSQPHSMDVPVAFRVGKRIMISVLAGVGHRRSELQGIMLPHEATDDEIAGMDNWVTADAPYSVINNLILLAQKHGVGL